MFEYHKHVIRIREIPADPEQFKQIVKLAMDITADSDGGVDRLNITLLHQQFFDHFAESLEVCFREVLAAADDFKPFIGTAGHCWGEARGDSEGNELLVFVTWAGDGEKVDESWSGMSGYFSLISKSLVLAATHYYWGLWVDLLDFAGCAENAPTID